VSEKRPPTHRDYYRPKTPPTGIAKQLAAPEFVAEECTDRYEGDDLFEARKARAEQDPALRIALLEADHKTLAADVSGMKLSIVRIEGHQETGNAKLEGIQKSLDRLSQREHVTFTSTVEVDTAKKISDVNVQQAEQLDLVAARKAKREFWFKMTGSGAVGAVVLKVLQHFGVL
jgi:hypothetical protein